jgi:hypothetical protein
MALGIPVYNPLLTDFSVTYKKETDDKPVEYTARAQEISYFQEETIANHIKKHLADAVLNKRGTKISWRVDREKVLKEISLESME